MSPVAVRYATALFDVAPASSLDAISADLDQAVALCCDPTVAVSLRDPRVTSRERRETAQSLLGHCDPLVANTVALLIDRGRLDLLPQIGGAFQTLRDKHEGIVRADVASAIVLDHAAQDSIRERLKTLFGGHVVAEFGHDASLIGGLVVRVGDRVIDGSVKTRLVGLKATLVR